MEQAHPLRARDDVFECRTWFEGLLGVPATDGNRLDVLQNGDRIFPAMLDAIARSTRSVDLATFNFGGTIGTEFAEALAAKARGGVRVRLLLDRLGAARHDARAIDDLRAAGGRVAWFRALNNPRAWETLHRGHRKILVCDREVGFTGGVGIDDRWRGDARNPSERRDTHFRVRGRPSTGCTERSPTTGRRRVTCCSTGTTTSRPSPWPGSAPSRSFGPAPGRGGVTSPRSSAC
ncbi:MAG: phospholipase D-like domain-containing protein [Acidimicrobiales bacterium]